MARIWVALSYSSIVGGMGDERGCIQRQIRLKINMD